MDFYSELESRNLLPILRHLDYEPPNFIGWAKVKVSLLDIVQNKKSVYFEGDYDVDGLCCSLGVQEAFKFFGVKNFHIYRFRKRMHSVDPVAVQQCIQGHYDYFFVADTGSNDLELLKKLVKHGIKVIVLDHHETEYSYSDFGDDIAIINTMIENRMGGNFALSAGALCFTVMDLLSLELGLRLPQGFAAFAVTSLFADIMSMNNELNRSLYYYGTEIPEEELPQQLLWFKSEYSKFNARYIGFWYSPRINACFRSEQFSVLNDLYFNDLTYEERLKCVDFIEHVYTVSRELVAKVSDVACAFCAQMNTFVFVDLSQVDQYYSIVRNKLYNYTGLIANKLSNRYSKPCLTICPQDGDLKGSVRDLQGRNYLDVFRQLCYAGGHGAAFGIRINYLDYKTFIQDFENFDENYSVDDVGNKPIIINVDEDVMSVDNSMIEDMARYNEFSSPGVPVLLLQKRMVGVEEKYNNYYYKYDWDGKEIQSDTRIKLGETVLIKPMFSGRLKLLVQSRG